MPRGPMLPRTHRLDMTDDESRLLGLLWDRFILESTGEIETAIATVATINSHLENLRNTKGDEYIVDMWTKLKDYFDTLWEITGCACDNPDCKNHKDNPDNRLGGFGGLDILH